MASKATVRKDMWVQVPPCPPNFMKLRIELDERELAALAEIAAKKDLSPERVMIQALRVYQLIDMKMDDDPEWMQKHLMSPQMPKMAPYVSIDADECIHMRTIDGGCQLCGDPSY